MRTSHLLAAAVVAGSVSAMASPNVTVGSVRQDVVSRTVRVPYTLTGAPVVITVDFQTNGVSIGAQNFTNVGGDVNRLIQTDGLHEIVWRARDVWPDVTSDSFRAVVTAWAPDGPPDYMVVNIDKATGNDIRYYTSADALPDGGLANDVYRKDRIVMRRIPACGKRYRMGTATADGGHATREVPHLVTLTNDYYIGVYEVTQYQYTKVYGSNPSTFNSAADSEIRPVDHTCYNRVRGNAASGCNWPADGHAVGADAFMGKLRTRTGIDFDLPTMAQWEFACRAGTRTKYNNGSDTWSDDLGWVSANSSVDGVAQTHAVGQKLPNAWGLYDMHGNVGEWCLDWVILKPDSALVWVYPTAAEAIEPTGPATEVAPTSYDSRNYRAYLGGYYSSTGADCRSSARLHDQTWVNSDQNSNHPEEGFRLWCPAVAK